MKDSNLPPQSSGFDSPDSNSSGFIGSRFSYSLQPNRTSVIRRHLLLVGELSDANCLQNLIEMGRVRSLDVDVVGQLAAGEETFEVPRIFMSADNLRVCLFHGNVFHENFERVVARSCAAIVLEGRCDHRHWNAIKQAQLPTIGYCPSGNDPLINVSTIGRSYHRPDDLATSSSLECLRHWIDVIRAGQSSRLPHASAC